MGSRKSQSGMQWAGQKKKPRRKSSSTGGRKGKMCMKDFKEKKEKGMTFHKMRTRLAALGLALVMGLIPMGNISPAYAAEEPASQQENVTSENRAEGSAQSNIQAKHRVVAEDLTIKVNDKTFSIGTSLEGIRFEPEKDEVSFYKVVGDDGSEFQLYRAGTYTASYLVTPKDQQECYVVTRKIILTDTEGMANGSDNGGEKQKTDTDTISPLCPNTSSTPAENGLLFRQFLWPMLGHH